MWWFLACSAPDGDPDTDPTRRTGTATTSGTRPTVTPGCGDTIATTTGCLAPTVLPSGREAFLGVPFAEPPVGPLRFQGAVPKAPWSGVLEADALGPPCVQFDDTVTGLAVGDGAEDCLTLNVFRPSDAQDLPVLLFVHGGGHVSGSGSEDVYADDPALAEAAVLVTTNYRLGPLGFLAHPALSAEDPEGVSGNLGFRDVVTALEWVSDNAAALGGDPSRILVFGESAGGLETCALLASPRTAGRFSAAAVQSAPCGFVGLPLRDGGIFQVDGEAQGEALAADVGCAGADPVGCLRELDLATILAVGQTSASPLADGWKWGPWLDGVWLPLDPIGEVLARGDWARVPLLATVNADEGTVFTLGLAPDAASLGQWFDLYALASGVARADIAARYDPAGYGGSSEDAFAAMYTDLGFVCPTLFQAEALAGQVDVHGGWFTKEVPLLGAFHGAEVPYVFGTSLGLASPEELALSARMRSAWTSLVDGPTVAGVGAWPEAPGEWVAFDVGEPVVVGPPRAAECSLWRGSRLDPYPR